MSIGSRHSWNSPEYVDRWIHEDVLRDLLALPRRIAAEVVRDADLEVRRVVDIGSGPGGFLRVFLDAFPAAEGIWIDASEPMEGEAKHALADLGDRVSYTLADASDPARLVLDRADVVVTSRMAHHFSEETIRALYATVREALPPGGFFFNLDHFASPPGWEPRYRRVRSEMTGRKKDSKDRHPHEHPFHLVATHLGWLEAAGFDTPDVAWKGFFTALLAARVAA